MEECLLISLLPHLLYVIVIQQQAKEEKAIKKRHALIIILLKLSYNYQLPIYQFQF